MARSAGVDAIIVSDGSGRYAVREFLRLEQFRELVTFPAFAETCPRKFHGARLPAILHSCAPHQASYLDDLVATGLSAVHPLQAYCGDGPGTVKSQARGPQFASSIIDSSRTLPYGTPEDVLAEVRRGFAYRHARRRVRGGTSDHFCTTASRWPTSWPCSETRVARESTTPGLDTSRSRKEGARWGDPAQAFFSSPRWF